MRLRAETQSLGDRRISPLGSRPTQTEQHLWLQLNRLKLVDLFHVLRFSRCQHAKTLPDSSSAARHDLLYFAAHFLPVQMTGIRACPFAR
jgi:hypothetical protein